MFIVCFYVCMHVLGALICSLLAKTWCLPRLNKTEKTKTKQFLVAILCSCIYNSHLSPLTLSPLPCLHIKVKKKSGRLCEWLEELSHGWLHLCAISTSNLLCIFVPYRVSFVPEWSSMSVFTCNVHVCIVINWPHLTAHPPICRVYQLYSSKETQIRSSCICTAGWVEPSVCQWDRVFQTAVPVCLL